MIEHAGAAVLWAEYMATLPADERDKLTAPEVWAFGDGPELADELGALVKQGIKTATADLVWITEYESRPIPKAGDYSVILDGAGDPLCIIETTDVTIRPYEDVPPEFAYDEGEGDRSLDYWRQAHWRYFGRRCADIGRQPSLTMLVVCEHFRLVYRPH